LRQRRRRDHHVDRVVLDEEDARRAQPLGLAGLGLGVLGGGPRRRQRQLGPERAAAPDAGRHADLAAHQAAS
jgi:hypothetical protein